MEGVRATREEVKRFLFNQDSNYGFDYVSGKDSDDGYGFGLGSGKGSDDGHGFSSGSGRGSDDGYGFGLGSGKGSDDGHGFGPGDGYGSGPGFGFGYGSGSGPGFGFGYGNGDVTALNGNIVNYIDNVPTIIIQVHGNFAYGYIVKEDLTVEPCFIAKVGNSFAHGKTLKEAVADAEAKELGKMTVEERIAKFVEAFGSLDSEHLGKEFYDWHHILTGSCRMGRDGFCKSHNIDLAQKYTVRYFLDITKDSYGSDVIKMIIKAYENIEE